jgi:hypothetical protein
VKRPSLLCAAAAALAAGLCLFSCSSDSSRKAAAITGLLLVKQQVENQLKNRMDGLSAQVGAFSRVVASDRDFSMKVLVEKDRSAPEVTGFAPRYMEAMGLSVLSLVNSRDTLLSCGQFPASAGGPAPVLALRDNAPCFVMDNVKGTPAVLTLQAQARFTILDSVFFATGGVIVDDNFCSSFSLPQGYSLLCKQGGTVTGMKHVESISDVKDNMIVLNNAPHPAVSVPLPYAGAGEPPFLVIFADKPL